MIKWLIISLTSVLCLALYSMVWLKPVWVVYSLILSRATAGLLRLVTFRAFGFDLSLLKLFSSFAFFLGTTYLIVKGRFSIIRQNKFFLLFLLFFGWCALGASTYSIDKGESLIGLLRYFTPLVIYALIVCEVREIREIDNLIKFIVYSSLVPLSYGAYQYLSGTGFYKESMMSVNSTFEYPNPFSAYLYLIALLLIYLVQKQESRTMKIVVSCYLILIVGCLIFTGRRTAIICLGIGMIMFGFLIRKPQYVFLPVAVLFLGLLVNPSIRARFLQPIRDYVEIREIKEHQNLLSSRRLEFEHRDTFRGRVKYWRQVLEAYWEKPALGYGIGTSRLAIARYNRVQSANLPHNDYLRVLLETGLIGFLIFLSAFLRLIYDLFYFYITSGTAPHRGFYALSISWVCSFLVGISANNWISENSVTWYFFGVIALCYVYRRQQITRIQVSQLAHRQ